MLFLCNFVLDDKSKLDKWRVTYYVRSLGKRRYPRSSDCRYLKFRAEIYDRFLFPIDILNMLSSLLRATSPCFTKTSKYVVLLSLCVEIGFTQTLFKSKVKSEVLLGNSL